MGSRRQAQLNGQPPSAIERALLGPGLVADSASYPLEARDRGPRRVGDGRGRHRAGRGRPQRATTRPPNRALAKAGASRTPSIHFENSLAWLTGMTASSSPHSTAMGGSSDSSSARSNRLRRCPRQLMTSRTVRARARAEPSCAFIIASLQASSFENPPLARSDHRVAARMNGCPNRSRSFGIAANLNGRPTSRPRPPEDKRTFALGDAC
jgi:hypothetical protein